jgi:hypothetical protein
LPTPGAHYRDGVDLGESRWFSLRRLLSDPAPYQPKKSVLDNQWQLPQVEPAQ